MRLALLYLPIARSRTGDSCTAHVGYISATQGLVGMEEIMCKQARFDAMTPAELEAYLVKNPAPAYVGPDGSFYITVGF